MYGYHGISRQWYRSPSTTPHTRTPMCLFICNPSSIFLVVIVIHRIVPVKPFCGSGKTVSWTCRIDDIVLLSVGPLYCEHDSYAYSFTGSKWIASERPIYEATTDWYIRMKCNTCMVVVVQECISSYGSYHSILNCQHDFLSTTTSKSVNSVAGDKLLSDN